MIPRELLERRKELQRAFHDLSGTVEIVPCNQSTLENGETVVTFAHNVRVRSAALRFVIREEFRDIDTEPQLYAFSYHVTTENDVDANQPLFRYECHPDFGDSPAVGELVGDEDGYQNPYTTVPHFHPDNVAEERLRKLHYPFHRTERKAVIFALVNWLRVDLVQRFHAA